MWHLLQHIEHRDAPMNGRLLRYANGRPIIYHRYDSLWNRVGENLSWAGKQSVSTHWLRYTTLTCTQRHQQRRGQHHHLRPRHPRRNRIGTRRPHR